MRDWLYGGQLRGAGWRAQVTRKRNGDTLRSNHDIQNKRLPASDAVVPAPSSH